MEKRARANQLDSTLVRSVRKGLKDIFDEYENVPRNLAFGEFVNEI